VDTGAHLYNVGCAIKCVTFQILEANLTTSRFMHTIYNCILKNTVTLRTP
jgi:hypothetical protein